MNCESDMRKSTQSLNGIWLFCYDPDDFGEASGYSGISIDRSDWSEVNVPSCWDDSNYDGVGWYATRFKLENYLKNQNIAIIFDSVDDDAVIYLNGEKIHEHGGYGVRFCMIVNEKLNMKGDNLLVVKVLDTGGQGGINGKVYLQSFKEETELFQTKFFYEKSIPVPAWVRDAVIYEIYIRAYSNKGDFNSVTVDLHRLKNMGIDCIWLMPIFPVGELKRKGSLGSPYSVKDFKKVNPEFGTENDFENLVLKAHKFGIKVILDIACNHSAWDNPLIEEHPDWYTKCKKGIIISPNQDWTDVADFDYDNAELKDYMWDVLEYWVRKFDIDGYRLDVAELVPYDFWTIALKRLQEIKPDVLMLAEGDHPRLYVAAFHLSYAWDTRKAMYRILNLDSSATLLYDVLEKEYYRYPKNYLRMRFSENHDETRAAQFFGIQQTKVATVLSFTLPGVPMIYMGQEVGATENPSLFEKSVIDWGKPDQGFRELYSDLIRLRSDFPVLRYGKYVSIGNTQMKSIFSFARINKDNPILIIVNMSTKKQNVLADVSKIMESGLTENLELLLGHADYSLDNSRLKIVCEPFGYYLFEISD